MILNIIHNIFNLRDTDVFMIYMYRDLIYFGDIIIKIFPQPMEDLILFLLIIVRSLFEIPLHEKFATNGIFFFSHKVLVSEKVFKTLDSIMAHLLLCGGYTISPIRLVPTQVHW
jgi:hypothetical protein